MVFYNAQSNLDDDYDDNDEHKTMGNGTDEDLAIVDAYYMKLSIQSKKSKLNLWSFHDNEAPDALELSDSSTASSSDCSSFDGSDRKVHFGNVSVRFYSLTLGTHSKNNAYPLTLDWSHSETESFDIDIFEDLCSAAKSKRKRKAVRGIRRPTRLTPAQRFQRLLGVTGLPMDHLYELELERTLQFDDISNTACDSDEGFIEDEERNSPYQLCDVDEYQIAEC